MEFKKLLFTDTKPSLINIDEIYLRKNAVSYSIYYQKNSSIKCKRVPWIKIKKILELSDQEEQIKQIYRKFIQNVNKTVYVFHLVSGELFTGYIDDRKRIIIPELYPTVVNEKMVNKYDTLPRVTDDGWNNIKTTKPPRFRKILKMNRYQNIYYGYYDPEEPIQSWRYLENGMGTNRNSNLC